MGKFDGYLLLSGAMYELGRDREAFDAVNRAIDIEGSEREIGMGIGDVLRVVKRVVDVGAAVFKGREHKAHFRRRHHPVLIADAEIVLVGKIAKRGLGHFHGTYGAQDIGKYVFAVCGFVVLTISGF